MIAALFPGQGSQENGMGKALYDAFPAAKAILDRAEATLPGLLSVMWDGKEDELKLTENTQPALLAVGVAAYEAYVAQGGAKPDFVAGHSLGEWTAHVCAGTVSLEDALQLVRKRGQYMQQAVPVGVGAMAAVLKLSAQTIQELTVGIAGVEVANFNSPEQTVISGTLGGISQATEVLKEHKARVVTLPVSAPFHSSLMKPAAENLKKDMDEVVFSAPNIPVYSNVLAAIETSPERIQTLLLGQISSSVRWVEIQQALQTSGVTKYLEFGSGKVLTGLLGRTLEGATGMPITNPEELANALA